MEDIYTSDNGTYELRGNGYRFTLSRFLEEIEQINAVFSVSTGSGVNEWHKFYLDALRIYDPIAPEGENLTTDEETALTAYKDDKEAPVKRAAAKGALVSFTVDGNLAETVSKVLSAEVAEEDTVTWVGKVLNLESKVAMKYVIDTKAYTGELADLCLQVTYVNYAGQTVSTTVTTLEDYNAALGQYAFSFDGLLAAELRTVVAVQVYSGDTPVSCTLEYSADTYGANKTGLLGELCKALYAYSDSAKAYFAQSK